jgi:hypothetical protein
MSETPPNTGPSRKTLENLLGTMATYMDAKDKGARIAKGKVHQVLRPRKFCKVCGALWDRKFVDPDVDTEMEGDICKKCDGMLKEGYVAVVCAKEPTAIWMRGVDELKPYSGSIMHVSHETFVAARNRIKELEK